MLSQLSPLSLDFPPVENSLVDPNGLLAFGGDLSTPRLIAAYEHGIFPWFCDGEPIMWWSPNPRTVFLPGQLHVSRSLKKFVRKTTFSYSINQAFEEVIQACAEVHEEKTGTWITEEMINAYVELHQLGKAHSVEVWQDNELVGGLYGVLVGSTFCGESMFHKATNASKCALLALETHLSPAGLKLIDCQVPNEHLYSLGAIDLPRHQYIQQLNLGKATQILNRFLAPQAIMMNELAISTETR
ncbi:leucyl/phenylalanyl-tRNA--protein transferase [Aliidiomarina sp. B3213]|uniref:leucyl/phenylalanyl-tRNA--protein transferase n=1 Tax=Aliidiomarina sp. B3213 TaxID=2249757 RepID=UPI001A9EBD25|nr:leucyl/phenylalanyl-tRNA--protein transferase [Aliidiomarina sp. B3213]